MIDERDLRIIEVLMENSKTPLSEIGGELGISDTAVRKRIEQLKEYGIIEGFTIKLNPKSIGFNVHAFIGVDINSERYHQVIREVKEIYEIKSLFTATGDHMMMAEVWAETSAKLEEVMAKLKKISGVTKICPAILVERVK